MDIRSLLSAWEVETLGSTSASTEPQGSSAPGNVPSNPLISGTAPDLYHGAQAPASTSLLAQTGISAYTQLQNVLASSVPRNSAPLLSPDRLLSADPQPIPEELLSRPMPSPQSPLDSGPPSSSAKLLTQELTRSSPALKSAYDQAVARLPSALQGKDWGFSASEDGLVFTPNQDPLSAQDMATLKRAFAAANIEPAAKQVAAALTALILLRKSGPNSEPDADRRIDLSTLDDAVDLRAYLNGTAPSSKYHPPTLADRPPIPTVLGGMYLGELNTARPEFLEANGSVVTDTEAPVDESEDTEPNTLLHGQCLCGSVRFTVENRFEYAFYCHCSRCRLRTGSVFAAIAGIGVGKVQITSGDEDLLIEGDCADGYGARCSRCHVFLFAAVRGRQYMHVSLGVLDGAPSRLPDHHIYVGSKAPWFQITDGLPQYEELP